MRARFFLRTTLSSTRGLNVLGEKKSEMDVHVRMTKWTHHTLCMYTSERKGVPLAMHAQLSLVLIPVEGSEIMWTHDSESLLV